MGQEPERIIKEHRRWTQWVQNSRRMWLGNLVLTNRRLMFLHKIESSDSVKSNIKRLADAPMETVLNYAFTLNPNNFQIPLNSIINATIGVYKIDPFPHMCLTVTFYDKRLQGPNRVSFQFIRPLKETFLKPQIVVDWGWGKTIRQTVKEAAQ